MTRIRIATPDSRHVIVDEQKAISFLMRRIGVCRGVARDRLKAHALDPVRLYAPVDPKAQERGRKAHKTPPDTTEPKNKAGASTDAVSARHGVDFLGGVDNA